MEQAKEGDKVKVWYKGFFEDGSVFDSLEEDNSMEFKIGDGTVLKGFEDGVIGLKVGENTSVVLSPEQAYGYPKEELMATVEKSEIPSHINIKKGEWLEIRGNEGDKVDVIIQEIEEDSIILNANHPLAGKSLNFEIRLLEIC